MKVRLRLLLLLPMVMMLTFAEASLSHTLKNKGESIHITKDNTDIIFKTRSKVTSVIKTAKSYLGTRYRYGGNTRKGIDCSGFTCKVFKKYGKKLPRTSREQSKVGKKVSKMNLKAGDLVFFSSKNTRDVTHVGIALGNGKFIHASSSKKKVIVTSLSKKYYVDNYKGARRL